MQIDLVVDILEIFPDNLFCPRAVWMVLCFRMSLFRSLRAGICYNNSRGGGGVYVWLSTRTYIGATFALNVFCVNSCTPTWFNFSHTV